METDWRLQNALDRGLRGKSWIRMDFVPDGGNDHQHCALCWEKFGEYWQHTGYRTAEGRAFCYHRRTVVQYDWVCDACFHDFREALQWTVDDGTTDGS